MAQRKIRQQQQSEISLAPRVRAVTKRSRPVKKPVLNASRPQPIAIVPPADILAMPSVSSRAQPHRAGHSLLLRIITWPVRQLWFRKWWLINLAIVVVSLLLVISEGYRQSTANARFDGQTVQLQNVPHHDTALVFGAGVLPDHTLTPYLKERVQTAVDLYKAHRVDSLLMSGDNSTSHYDEPTAMKAYAVKQGIDPSDVVIDYAGFNTYDSCYRAHAIFGVKSVTVVTQGYHLPRAVMTCQHNDMDTIGVAAKHTGRDWTVGYVVREHVSTAKAAVQLVLKPQPTVLGKTEKP